MACLPTYKGIRFPEMGNLLEFIELERTRMSTFQDNSKTTLSEEDQFIKDIKEEISGIPGLSIMQEYQITDYLFNFINSSIEVHKKEVLSTKDILDSAKDGYERTIAPRKKELMNIVSNLERIAENNPDANLQKLIENYKSEIKGFDIVQENWNIISEKALSKIAKYTGITQSVTKEDDVDFVDDTTEKEKSYVKTSLEDNGKDSVSYVMKRFWSSIYQRDPKGQIRTGFLGVPLYVGFDTVDNTMRQLLNSPSEVEADFETMVARLEENVENYPWLPQAIEKLKEADQQIQNEFVYNYNAHTLSMKFVMFSKGRDNQYTLKVYDTNSTEVTRVIREGWDSGLLQSPLTYFENGVYKINKERATYLLEQFESWGTTEKTVNNVINQEDRDRFADYLKKSGMVLPKEFFASSTKSSLFYNPTTGKREGFPQSSKFILNNQNLYDLIDKESGEVYINNVNLLTGNTESTSVTSISTRVLQDWLGEFGINVSEETISELKRKPLEIVTPTGKESIAFKDMFRKSKNTNGIFGSLAQYLQDVSGRSDTSLDEKPTNHPFHNIGGILQRLSKIESKYALYTTTNSFRDGDKSIFGFTNPKYATDATRRLKTDPQYLNTLRSKSFNGNSFILGLLSTSEDFKEKFNINHIGITAFKELGKKVFGDNSVTSLSDSDVELLKLGLFQDTEQGTVSEKLNGLELRMGRMFYPTMSDKSQMLALHTAVLNISAKHFVTVGENTEMREELIEAIYSQLVKPDLDRIANFHGKVKSTNIKGYDLAAQMFLMIPELNNLIDPNSGERVIALMKNNPMKYNADWYNSTIKPLANKVIEKFIASEVNAKRAEWENNGFIEGENNIFLDKKYMSRIPGTPAQKIEVALYDYVINSLISNANVNMAIAGDIAMYSQDKIKKFFQDGDITLPKEEYKDTAYQESLKLIGTNVGKRLALLLAPGKKISNSKNQTYTQVYLEDFVDITSNVETLVELFYGKAERNKVAPLIQRYNTELNPEVRANIVEELTDSYPQIADYFDLEATDAQEYTTIFEHLSVLEGQGRISTDQLTGILDAVSKNQDLNSEQLKLVMQPIKPVYTGFKDEPHLDTMRMVYVKSSSFPLIPQLTRGTELDKLRTLLEKYEGENKNNSFVRASYQTANKVGANKNALKIFNSDGTFNDSLTIDDIQASSLILDRENFKIQQDVPFKSGKKKEDTVSLGTQTLKLLFGDGIMELDGFTLEGESYTGTELKQEFDKTYVDYIQYRRDLLLKELGVDAQGQPINVEITMEKLQDLLKREASERGYPRQDIEALKLTPVVDSTGKVIDVKFTNPLWLSPNSNRYESLLNAIVANRLVNIKMPGNAYVVGSEAGFKTSTNIDDVQNKGNIIYTSKWQGELKAYSDGNLTQVLAPSKFRDNKGNMISFFDKKGKPNLKYIEVLEDGSYRLKEDMISPELLALTSFRIPTSSHVSMSQIEIVGILPHEVGDLMIVPKNLTKQKGLDFDIDKETTYQLWTYTDKDGRIKTLDEEGKNYLLAEITGYNENNITEAVDEVLTLLLGGDYKSMVESGTSLKEVAEDKLNQKLYENRLVKIHSSVLSNPNAEVQKKINKVLSIDFAKSQAELIDGVSSIQGEQKYFSILSDQYQKQKMALGASGKLGIGVYSNYVTFNSLAQQLENPIQITEFNEQGDKVNSRIQIGGLYSDGIFGRTRTLDGSRTIAEVFAERQNTATDNEKEQIMGRVNVNELTINVDSLLSALGFDKGKLSNGTEVSIPYLFISQPIIKDYVTAMRSTKSNTREFDFNAKNTVIQDLKSKYKIDTEANENDRKLLTPDLLFNNISGNVSSNIQNVVLDLFLELDEIATSLSKVQSIININNSGLGKNFFETTTKFKRVNDLLDHPKFTNVLSLIGKQEDGKIIPTTPVGSMVIEGLNTGYNLWNQFFPYDNKSVERVTEDILKIISTDTTSEAKESELRKEIFQEMKKFFVSSQALGIIQGDPQSERQRLFIDTDEKQSLSSYLYNLMTKTSEDSIKNNKLLGRFRYKINQDGTPSTIQFDNNKGENFDEDYLYMSLIELMEENKTLPNFNGEPYTSRDLAKDLISYAYLEGGIQEAIQFVKYIPVSYLNAIGFSSKARLWDEKLIPGIYSKLLGTGTNTFLTQYVQHHPNRLTKVSVDEVLNKRYANSKKDINDLLEFELSSEIANPPYVSTYNPFVKKGLKKYNLYKLDNGKYKRVSVLGAFGMSEYSIKSNHVESVTNPTFKAPTFAIEEPVYSAPGLDVFGIGIQTPDEIIQNVIDFDFQNYKGLNDIAKAIAPYVKNIPIKYADFVTKYGRENTAAVFDADDNAIYININSKAVLKDDQERIGKLILHEVVHSLTYNYIEQFVDSDTGKFKVENPPREILNLVLLWKEAIKPLGGESKIVELNEKFAKDKKTTLSADERKLYAVKDLHEFVAHIMTEPSAQQFFNEVPYLESGDNIFTRFKKIVEEILGKILGDNFKKENITYQAVDNVVTLLEKATPTEHKSRFSVMQDNNSELESLLGDTTDPNLEKPDNLDNFDNHFEC